MLAHEIGHVLGYDHDEDGIMAETLATGTRHMPTDDQLVVDAVSVDVAFPPPREG